MYHDHSRLCFNEIDESWDSHVSWMIIGNVEFFYMLSCVFVSHLLLSALHRVFLITELPLLL